jgi:hypothetical protein
LRLVLNGLVGVKPSRGLNVSTLKGDEPIKGDLVFGQQFERVLFGKGCRRLLGENWITIELQAFLVVARA